MNFMHFFSPLAFMKNTRRKWYSYFYSFRCKRRTEDFSSRNENFNKRAQQKRSVITEPSEYSKRQTRETFSPKKNYSAGSRTRSRSRRNVHACTYVMYASRIGKCRRGGKKEVYRHASRIIGRVCISLCDKLLLNRSLFIVESIPSK